MKFAHWIAPALALAALGQAQAAQAAAAQKPCIAPADLGDTAVYALPIAFDAARTACAGKFAKDGFMARGGEKFIAGFRARQNAAWPGAFRTMQLALAEEGNADNTKDLNIMALAQTLPEESLRPFVDGLMGQMIAGEIKPGSCSKIERGLELISPLPVDNVAGLMGYMVELLGLDKPAICAASLPAKKN